jgi:hypothetical protein
MKNKTVFLVPQVARHFHVSISIFLFYKLKDIFDRKNDSLQKKKLLFISFTENLLTGEKSFKLFNDKFHTSFSKHNII